MYRAGAQGGSELAPGLSSVGGSQNLRFYWKEFVNEVDVLVFMVDSADRLRLPWARQELHKLLDKDPDLPVVVVANKQVRAMGGWRRPVELDPLISGQGQGAQERFRPRSTTWSTWLRSCPRFSACAFPSFLILILCLSSSLSPCHPPFWRKRNND